MEIYLMQHGPNFSKDQDPEEGLTPQGQELVQAAAKALKRLGLGLDAVLASPKKRSQQTAVIVAVELGFDPVNLKVSPAIKAMAPPAETIGLLAGLQGSQRVLVAGHLPNLAQVAASLLSDGSPATVAFERGGCCRIDVDQLPTHAGRLVWYLPPDILTRLAG